MHKVDQCIAIAKACGWKVEQLKSGWLWTKPGYTPRLNEGPPPYTSCLNAMHEAENTLKGYDRIRYHDILCGLLGNENIHGTFATADQRAEAFLKTLGLWVESNVQREYYPTPPAADSPRGWECGGSPYNKHDDDD